MLKNLLICSLLFFCSCQSSKEETKPIVLVSITPYQIFIEEIVEGFASVESVVPANQNPHFFTPSIKQTTKIGNAKIYFRIGENFEEKILPALLEKNPEMTIVDLRKNVSLIPIEIQHEGHTHGGFDIHFWLSPKVVKTQLEQIKKTLITTFPNKKPLIEERVSHLKDRLTSLQNQISNFALDGKTFLTSHEAFAYFCREFGCTEVALEMGQKEATVKYLEKIFSLSKEKNIKLMVIIPQINDKGARRVSEKLSLETVVFDPFAKNYFENLVMLAERIEKDSK